MSLALHQFDLPQFLGPSNCILYSLKQDCAGPHNMWPETSVETVRDLHRNINDEVLCYQEDQW